MFHAPVARAAFIPGRGLLFPPDRFMEVSGLPLMDAFDDCFLS
jgi:hypothetical protein